MRVKRWTGSGILRSDGDGERWREEVGEFTERMLTKALRFGGQKICLRGSCQPLLAVVNCEYIVHACRSSRVQVDCIGRQASIPLANLDYIYRSTIDLLPVVVW